jgi:rhodanese-related sulfurtransferase
MLAAVVCAGSPAESQVATSPSRITLERLIELQAANAVLIIDVRPEMEYQAGHIPGAISTPLDTLMTRVTELKKATKPIVAYCT